MWEKAVDLASPAPLPKPLPPGPPSSSWGSSNLCPLWAGQRMCILGHSSPQVGGGGISSALCSPDWHRCGESWPLDVHGVVAFTLCPQHVQTPSGNPLQFLCSASPGVWDSLKLCLHGWPSVTFLGLSRVYSPETWNLPIGWSCDLNRVKTAKLLFLAKLGLFRYWWWHRSDLISSCLFEHWILNFPLLTLGAIMVAGSSSPNPSGPAFLQIYVAESAIFPWQNLLKCSYRIGEFKVAG